MATQPVAQGEIFFMLRNGDRMRRHDFHRAWRSFDLPDNMSIAPDVEGVFRSGVFPGLWVHADALLSFNHKLVERTLRKGLKSAEHKAYVQDLAQCIKEHQGICIEAVPED